MNFFKEIQQPVNEGPLDAVRARMDARRDPPEKQSPNLNTPLPPVPPYVAPTAPTELKAGDIIGYRPKNAKMLPIKAKVLKLLSGDRAMVSVSSPKLIAQNNDSPVITIGPLSDLDIQNPYKGMTQNESIVNEAAVDWLPAYNALLKNNGAPLGGGSINDLNWKKSMALSAKDNGITGGQELANFVFQYAQNNQFFKTSNSGREDWNQLTNEIASLMKQAPTMDEMRAVVKQQDADKHQQNLTAIQQQLDLENAPLQHELSVQALLNKAELDKADQKELLELDMEARLAIIKIKQDLELDAKERLIAIEREIEDRKEREDIRKHELELAQAGYKHELAVINATAEGEYKKAKLEADYQIQIKQLDNIDNAGERQNRLDQINTEKAKQLELIDAETKSRIEVMQKEVDVERQQSDIKINQAFMMTFNPIWGAALTAAHAAGSTWKAGINNLNKALAMLSKPIMPKAQKESLEEPQMQNNKPFQAKPMAVSLDYWKKAVLARYPNAVFSTEKRPNGSTIASMSGSGNVGTYSPSTGYAKVGPAEDKAIKQGVGEAGKPDAYQRDEINATSGFGKNSYAYQMDGGANDEDHEGDAWREKQEKSGTWYIRLNGKLIKDKTGKPYSFHGKAAANKAALTMQAKLFNQGKEFMLTTNPNDKVAEGTLRESDSPVAGAITRRIMLQRSDLLSKYGPVKVMAAIDDVADFVGDTEEIGSSDVSGWIKQVEQTLSGMGEGIEEASLAQMRDYFNQPDDSMKVNRAPGTPGKNPAGIPHEIQTLVNKMYHSGKVTPEEFKILQDFQRKTKINVGIKEADTSTGNTGYDSMLAVMKAVDAGNDATFNLGGEPITLDYNEARFLAGRYKAFLKAGRQAEFLKYMENPVAFDRLMKQLRDLMDKQQNFKGSVQGERGIEEGSQRVDSLVTNGLKIMRGPTRDDAIAALKTQVGERDFNERRGFYNFYVRQLMDMYNQQGVAEGIADTIKAGAKKAFDKLGGGSDEELLQRLEKETGGKRPEKKDMPPVKENEYFCNLDKVVKEIPEGYKRTADGYITRI